MPKANSDYWKPKLRATQKRDKAQSRLLESAGWRVLRFWEHMPSSEVASAISRAVGESELPA